jgi:hypothetical protein
MTMIETTHGIVSPSLDETHRSDLTAAYRFAILDIVFRLYTIEDSNDGSNNVELERDF